jgi:xanthine dehydrogenase accessory factor
MIEYASNRIPLKLMSQADGVLAMITATEGASYRKTGTMMAFTPDGRRTGSLSSGCIEDDIADHAKTALATGRAIALRYGIGSPFFDLKLPCGGGLSILLIPNPDRALLTQVLQFGTERQSVSLSVGLQDGDLTIADAPQPGRLVVRLEPELRFWVYGHGVEALSFALMTQAAGYDVTLFGQESLQSDLSRIGPLNIQTVTSFRTYTCPIPDNRTAITLFFHDHENEARLLSQFLPTDAFFIGAQGSLRARTRLLADLAALGVTPEHLSRLRPTFGLIPSCRDPRTLAVSVMAHVLSVAGG